MYFSFIVSLGLALLVSLSSVQSAQGRGLGLGLSKRQQDLGGLGWLFFNRIQNNGTVVARTSLECETYFLRKERGIRKSRRDFKRFRGRSPVKNLAFNRVSL